MRFGITCGAALVLASAICFTCQAQTGGGAGGQGGGQTGGGQTGAQGGAQVGAQAAYPPALYQMNNVAKSLNLGKDEITKLNDMTTKLQTSMGNDFNKLTDLSPTERAARIQQLNQQYQTQWMKGAGDIMNQDQLNRYRQLQLQYGGFNSLMDPEVQKSLNLTDAQRNSLQANLDWSGQQMQKINQTGQNNAEQANQMYQNYQKDFQGRWNQYLTPQQQQAWGKMVGEQFQFQPIYTTPTIPQQPKR